MNLDNEEADRRRTGVMPLINVVPLVGVLAAVMVVIMVAMPGRTATLENDQSRGCVLCFGERCEYLERVGIEVGASGLVQVNGHEMPATQLRQAIRLPPQPHQINDIIIEVRTDPQAEYSDMMDVVGILKELGLEDRQISVRS
ncbi:ExbD/TolR family protein [Arenimonas sp.]|uniref:ExbD/TolR family protein n=1 Tax=Arenimonas sp. TaxID=1872635 RepID=UPI0039E72503